MGKKKWNDYALRIAEGMVEQYYICGDGVFITHFVNDKGIFFVKAKRSRFDDCDGEPDDEHPDSEPPLTFGKRKNNLFDGIKPSYVG